MDYKLNTINLTLMKLEIFTNGIKPILIFDENLKEIAISILKDGFPHIIINNNLLPDNYSAIVHIVAHEFGHIFYRHIYENPLSKSMKELQLIEDEADLFASYYISYQPDVDKKDIITFFMEMNSEDENYKYHRLYLLYKF